MPIQVTCSGCGRNYRVPDERAGTRARCKHCGAVIEIPSAAPPPDAMADATSAPEADAFAQPAAAAVPPPPIPAEPIALAPLPAIPLPPAFPSAPPPPFQYPPAAPFQPPPPRNSHFGLWAVIIGLIVLVIGGVSFAIYQFRPVSMMSDAEVQKRVAGTWSVVKSVQPGITGTIQYGSDGTYNANLVISGRPVTYGGTFVVQNHYIVTTQTTLFGRKVHAPRNTTYGPVREVTSHRLVMATKYQQDEEFKRVGP